MKPGISQLFAESTLPTSKYDTYFAVYEDLFSRFKGTDVTVVEIGILGGGSLDVWRKYFGEGARIIGVDLNPAIKPVLQARGFEVFIGDQADAGFWNDFFATVGPIDILLDDGGHSNLQTWTTLTHALPHVRDGGLVVIEDTHASYLKEFGNPGPRSFVSRSKMVCDRLHSRSSRIPTSDKAAWLHEHLFADCDPAAMVFCVRFYESLIAFHVDRRQCTTSTQNAFGDPQQLPDATIPVDFRSKGRFDPDLAEHNIWARLRHLLRQRFRYLFRK